MHAYSTYVCIACLGCQERLDELMRSNETQLELLRRHEETTGTVQQQAGALAAALQGLQEKVAVAQQSLQDLRGEADRQKTLGAKWGDAASDDIAARCIGELVATGNTILEVNR